MARRLRFRFWLESIVSGLAAALAIVTLFWKDWIEAVFGVDPDHGSGAFEWLIVVALVAAAVLLGASARWEWRATRRLAIPQPNQ